MVVEEEVSVVVAVTARHLRGGKRVHPGEVGGGVPIAEREHAQQGERDEEDEEDRDDDVDRRRQREEVPVAGGAGGELWGCACEAPCPRRVLYSIVSFSLFGSSSCSSGLIDTAHVTSPFVCCGSRR